MIIGLFLKHIKAYKGIKFIPIGFKYNFSSYVGENGAGKSSILEALDSFLNNKPYSINKSAIVDGISTTGNEPFISPVFLIDKTKIIRQKKNFESISNFFWNISKKDTTAGVKGSMKDFFDLRDQLSENGNYTIESHYLLIMGETNLISNPKIYFGSFQAEKKFIEHMMNLDSKATITQENKSKKLTIADRKKEIAVILEKNDWKKTLQELKNIYSYVYLPVELEVESFTKIETNEMQKIFDKKLKDEIESALVNVNIDRNDGINSKLEFFISEIENILNNKYIYKTGQQRNNKVTKSDLINKILEVYFQKRVLYKKDGNVEKKVSELSAGEKRQALINVVYAFLKRESYREKMVIIGIDEPENSLHTSLIYDQFEKLKEVSENNQILVTTHWYGFLPIISEGNGHFLSQNKERIDFETYDLYDYRAKIKKDIENSKNQIPNNFILKSTYDLVQSIYYSIRNISPYNWIICEGLSEKIYFEYFFMEEIESKKLRILPMGGQSKVIRLFKYLSVPIDDDKKNCKGKIYCLIDTDQNRCEEIDDKYKILKLKRLSNGGKFIKTDLLTLKNPDTWPTDIEQSLNPIIFKKTIGGLTREDKYEISHIEDPNGNCDFIKNFKNLGIENFFKENSGENKVIFAKKYVENMLLEEKQKEFIPQWVTEIKRYFKA